MTSERRHILQQLAEARHELLIAQSNVIYFEKKLGELAIRPVEEGAIIIPFPIQMPDGGGAA